MCVATQSNQGGFVETLDIRLQRGPLTLAQSVRCAYELGKAVRTIHKDGAAHGSISCQLIELRPAGAFLKPTPSGLRPATEQAADVRAFGKVLCRLFPSQPDPEPDLTRLSQRGIAASARRMAAMCLSADWTIQKAVNEFHFLDVMLRRHQETQEAEEVLAAVPLRAVSPVRNHGDTRIEETDKIAEPQVERVPVPLPQPQQAARALVFGEPTRSGVLCPRCQTHFVHPSSTRTGFEKILKYFRIEPLRCHRCSYRFLRILHVTFTKEARD